MYLFRNSANKRATNKKREITIEDYMYGSSSFFYIHCTLQTAFFLFDISVDVDDSDSADSSRHSDDEIESELRSDDGIDAGDVYTR